MIPYASIFTLLAICLIVLSLLFKKREGYMFNLDSPRPMKSPFYVALSLGFVPRIEEAVASFLLYWKGLGVIEFSDDAIMMVNVLPDDAPSAERMIFQAVFGRSAIAYFSKLDGRRIVESLSAYGNSMASPFNFESKESKKQRILILSISFISSFLAGMFSAGWDFSLLSLSGLLCTLALFVIVALLSRSYFEHKGQMGILSKIRFFVFPSVCAAFFLGLYGYIVSTEFGKGCGLYMAIVVFLIIFTGAFYSFFLFRLDRNRESELEEFRLYASRLEKEEAQDGDIAYCMCLNIHTGSELSLELRKRLSSCGISGVVNLKSSSGFGFFGRDWRF